MIGRKSTNTQGRDAWIVIVEWDGQHPPTKWYRYLSRLAGDGVHGAVRGDDDREKLPLDRRFFNPEEDTRGIVVQEGTIICPSESLARYLAYMARFELYHDGLIPNPPTVAIGRVVITTDVGQSQDAVKLSNKISGILGKRGRKPAKQDWVITCPECLEATAVHASVTVSCPACGGLRIHSRKGKPAKFNFGGSMPIADVWRSTRFFGPHFEPVTLRKGSKAQPPAANTIEIFSPKEDDIVQNMMASNTLMQFADKLPRDIAIMVLDGVFAAAAYHPRDARTEARVLAITAYLSRYAEVGMPPKQVPLSSIEFDIFDAAVVLGSADVVEWFLAYGLD